MMVDKIKITNEERREEERRGEKRIGSSPDAIAISELKVGITLVCIK